MVLFIGLFVALAAAVIYWLRRRQRSGLYLKHLARDLRSHPLTAGLLLAYSLTCGAMMVLGFAPPLVAAPLALPIVAGACLGWWEAQAAGSQPAPSPWLAYGILAGFLAMVLPAMITVLGNAALAWAGIFELSPGEAGAFIAESAGWAAGLLGLGVVLGVVGSYGGAWVAHSRMQSPR